MKILKESYGICFIMMLLTSMLSAQTKFFTGSFTELMAKAQDEKKPVFIDLYFTGCMPCKQMDENVFPKESVAELLNEDFIAYKINVFKEGEKELGLKMMKKFAITGFPSFLILSPKGQTINVFGGFQGEDNLTAFLKQALIDYHSGKNLAYSNSFEINYPSFYKGFFETKKLTVSQAELNQFLEDYEDHMDEISFLTMMKFVREGAFAKFYLDHLIEFAAMYGKTRVGMSTLQKVSYAKTYAAKSGDMKFYENFLSNVKTLIPEDKWQGLSVKQYYLPLYEETENIDWLLLKLQNSDSHWVEISNACGALINTYKSDQKVLKELLKLYRVGNVDRYSQGDRYKMAAIYLHLEKYKQAKEHLEGIEEYRGSFGLNEDNIEELRLAIAEKAQETFEVKDVKDFKPFNFN
ncbi:thioredoxin family protein [Zhouia amylolytica]|uniref:thioredoxin family protein n=1 Tax=Zhouia amylolytica TaxID=376730 RepID=UPI0020CFB3DA|nr:thioredoxin family protein [Zhouia amylolytica]MCQ0110560.1 thioredoxin family protein [Zhouia amylolytica]